MEHENDKNGKVLLDYYDGIIASDVMERIESDFREIGVGFYKRDKSNTFFNFLEDYTNQIILFLSNDIVQAYVLGLMTNATYDILKKSMLNIIDNIKGKSIFKVSSGPKVEEQEATFGLKIKISEYNSLDIRLSGEFNDEMQGKIIDQAFEVIKRINQNSSSKIRSDYFAHYDTKKEEWDLCNMQKEIYKKVITRKEQLEKENTPKSID